MEQLHYTVREAKPGEFKQVGSLMVDAYAALEGFPSPQDQPSYYYLLANIGELTQNPGTKLIVAVSESGRIGGAVVYLGDMKYYGSGGSAPNESHAAGFRLLAVDPKARGRGIGKLLSKACVELARNEQYPEIIIHSTKAMRVAWKMYEKLGFKRSADLDFLQEDLQVFGFRLSL
jgi:GNAT superfamily N-acetyltransferase